VSGGTFKSLISPLDDVLINYFEGSVNDAEGTAQGRISRGLLPGQGMYLEWEPADEVAQSEKGSGTQ